MPASIKSILSSGSSGIVVEAECHLSNSLPGITIVGLGNKAVDESRERVRSAFANCSIVMPRKRITVNLAPADIPKESTSLDLAIALSILSASAQIREHLDDSTAAMGELGLTGVIRPIRGIIGKLLGGKQNGIHTFYIPYANLEQALLVPDVEIIAVRTLDELYRGLNHDIKLASYTNKDIPSQPERVNTSQYSLADVVGQDRAKRALEIAAAGGHNIMLSGPPGTGKSMLAKALPSILPPLNREEMLEITHLHSLVGRKYEDLIVERPFRSPHHSASHIAIVGGGSNLRPGEVSLAHRGVLFMDEMPEFSRVTIEALRQPLEDRTITIARAKDSALYPASFILVATANPCPCGNFATGKQCSCSANQILRYRQKLSGPIMDRIDLYVDVDEIDHTALLRKTALGDDKIVRQRIIEARQLQSKRYKSLTKLNGDTTNKEIKSKLELDPEAHELLNVAAKRLDLSARSYMRIIKVARTIADLGKSSQIRPEDVSEAVQYRSRNTTDLP